MLPRLALALLVPVALVNACSRRAELDGAAVAIPVYSPTRLESHHESWTSDELAQPQKFRSLGWVLSSPDGWEQIDKFYAAQPELERNDGDEPADGPPAAADQAPETPGQVVYRWLPSGWSQGEGIWVMLTKASVDGRTQLHVTQERLNAR